jgi:Sec7-like guanine-nucleotide exchange factor
MNVDFNIESKKLALIQWLTSLNDVSMIDKILELKQKETKDWWNEISDEEKESIEKGLSDAESGKLKPHSEIRKKYEKWL